MKKSALAGLCLSLIASVALAQQPGRSLVGEVILPGPPYISPDMATVAYVQVLNGLLAKAHAECGTYESVYWTGRILYPSATSVKEDIIAQFANRQWSYTVFDRGPKGEMFYFVAPANTRLIIGGWTFQDDVLMLVWCNARGA